MNAQTKIALAFCTGCGQSESRATVLSDGRKNTHPTAGTPYNGITGKQIAAMIQSPPSVDKAKGQWFIPSAYIGCDARDHDVQRQHGAFHWLALDVDGNNLSMAEIKETLYAVLGDCCWMIYSSRSATEDNRKWRALVPLKEPIAGVDYHDTATAFFDLLEQASEGVLIPDRALARPGQLVYLPNKGTHYEHEITKAPRLALTADHPIILRREDTRAKRAEAEAKAAAWRERRDRQAPTDSSSIVAAFNSAERVANLLAKYGYRQAGTSNDWRSPFQQSGSFATRDYGDYWISLSASDAAEGIGRDSKTGQRFGDAFDLFVHFEHGGGDAGFKAAVKAYAKEIGQDHKTKAKVERKEAAKLATPDSVNPEAVKLAARIAQAIKDRLPGLKDEPFVDPLTIRDMIEGAFWSGTKSRIFLLNRDESLVQFAQVDAWKFLCRRFGSPIDADEIMNQWLSDALEELGEDDKDAGLSKAAKKEAIKAIYSETIDPILDYLKFENQRDHVEWSVDMFADRSRLEIRADVVRIVLTHKALTAPGKPDPAIVGDYRQHFPMIDAALEYIVAARFALDRKKAYLWLWASSDWGKGFLLGIMRDLGLVVEMSVKEIEATFEGKAVGRRPEDFKRAMILAVDEFKAVKSELKQLQSEIQLAPKYQLTSRVEIFTKLFLSAESVGSLVGERGVEDQFANRMSMLTGTGTLNDRPAYANDQGRYFRAIRKFVADELNRLIAEYRALGKEGAERRADAFLNAFIDQHGLGKHFTRLSDSLGDIAEEAVTWAKEGGSGAPAGVSLRYEGTQGYLLFAGRALDDFLAAKFTRAEVGTLSRRRMEIMEAMSADGRGNASHRVGGRQVKCIKLK